jgi:hypothetical protein
MEAQTNVRHKRGTWFIFGQTQTISRENSRAVDRLIIHTFVKRASAVSYAYARAEAEEDTGGDA